VVCAVRYNCLTYTHTHLDEAREVDQLEIWHVRRVQFDLDAVLGENGVLGHARGLVGALVVVLHLVLDPLSDVLELGHRREWDARLISNSGGVHEHSPIMRAAHDYV